MKRLFYLLFLISTGLQAQELSSPANLLLKGTRSWISVNWQQQPGATNGYRLYWSDNQQKPAKPAAILPSGTTRFYIRDVKANTHYYVWVETTDPQHTLTGEVTTAANWKLDSAEAQQLDIASSSAVPKGMTLFWHDEFNDSLLDRNKWHTTYYSNIDFLRKDNLAEMRNGELPEAAYTLNGHTITLFTNDSLPVKAFYPSNGRKISSIQTYDWRSNENLLDNSRGGYFEVRVQRNFTGKPQGLNTAYWFDSPGPDLKYYLQEGTTLDGVKGIRPKGQVFEIDVFENLDAQFVLHGHVDEKGQFVHNLNTHIAKGFEHRGQWVTHGILWTPNSIKHYINGQLIKAYTDKHQIYSPNHIMNVFLGAYGGGGSVELEVDYIRGYQWPLNGDNELPNPGFDANTTLLPWEGNGTLTTGRTGQGVLLKPGQEIEQYVYLDNGTDYQLSYWQQGDSPLQAIVENLKLVTGEAQQSGMQTTRSRKDFSEQQLTFATGKEYGNNMKTIRIAFKNTGKRNVILDDLTIRKLHP